MAITAAGEIRDLEREDLEAVAGLFQSSFRKPSRKNAAPSPSPELVRYLGEAFFDHPWTDPEIRSKVFVGPDAKVSGFIGVFPTRLELNGRMLRGAVAGSMTVANPKENPLAGARLLRSYLSGPQDISVTETANETALGMWQKLGHPLDAGYSMNWLRILRPATAGAYMLERKLKPAALLQPLGRLADRAAVALRVRPFLPADRTSAKITFRSVTPAEFADALLTLSQHYPLRPRWDAASLGWFVGQAEEKRNYGYPEWRVGFAADGRPLAAYVYFSRPGGIGWLMQAVSAPNFSYDLVDDLFAYAYEMGCSGMRGSGEPWLIPALMTRKALFYGRTYFLAQARDKSLLEPVKAGQALVSGLAGECWTRLIGDRFD